MKSALILASLAASAYAMPSDSDTYTVHQRRSSIQDGRFVKRSSVTADTKIPFQIALKQSTLQKAEDTLYDISNPASPNYGKHLSKKEVVNMFAASDESINSIKMWLVRHGIDEKAIRVSPTKTWITVDATAGVLEKALKTRYHVYRSNVSGQDHIGTEEYSLPNDLLDVVDFVRPGPSMVKIATRGTKPKPSPKGPQAIHEPIKKLSDTQLKALNEAIVTGPSGGGKADTTGNSTDLPPWLKICSEIVTPDCIAYLYKIPKGTGSNSTNLLGIYESLYDTYDQEDLDLFYKTAAPQIPAGTGPVLDLINGATAPVSQANGGGESLLDFQMAYPIIWPQNATLFQVLPDATFDIFGDFLAAVDSDYCSQDPYWNDHKMCGDFDPPNGISISYGGPEDPTDPKDSQASVQNTWYISH